LEGLTPKGRKVQARLDQLGHSREWLAGKLGVTDGGLAKWLRGDTVRPRGYDGWDQVWTHIAELLGVPSTYLLDDSKNTPVVQTTDAINSIVTYPQNGLLGTFRIPMPELEVELPKWPALPANEKWDMEPQDWMEFESVPNIFGRRNARDPERVVAPVAGSSMEPRLYDGDLCVIELDTKPRTGRIVLARNEDGKLTLKLLVRGRDNRYKLESINPAHGNAESDSWEMVGFLIGIIRDYKSGRGLVEWDFGGIGP
jgi:transcriptional regulator with XRE-family HTH domain